MLIPSTRHTPADLALWREYESADMVRSISAMISNTLGIIASTLPNPSYISISWGKDSVCLADLVLSIDPSVPLIWIAEEPMSNPHCRDVRDFFLKIWPNVIYHEMILDYGKDGFKPWLDANGNSKLFKKACQDVTNMYGKAITGYRSEESRVRKIRFAIWGLESDKSFCPIGYWKNADVFAYLAQRGLPAHPNYAMLGNGRYSRERLRVDCLAGSQGVGIGRDEWEYEYYSDIRLRL